MTARANRTLDGRGGEVSDVAREAFVAALLLAMQEHEVTAAGKTQLLT